MLNDGAEWLQVLSLHSTSKGFIGECGHRGGYLDVLNCPEPILVQLRKLMSINLCSNTIGQVRPAPPPLRRLVSGPRINFDNYICYITAAAPCFACISTRDTCSK